MKLNKTINIIKKFRASSNFGIIKSEIYPVIEDNNVNEKNKIINQKNNLFIKVKIGFLS